MSHIFGINWQRYHPDGYDFAHIEKMQYKAVTIYEWMWSDRDFCNNLLAALPGDAIIICRDHPLSEQKQDLYRNPGGTGERHASEWSQKIYAGKVNIPLERAYFQGINEPDSNQYQWAIDVYTTALVRNLAKGGARTAGWIFGVGHPSTVNLNPSGPVDWSWYRESAAAIRENGGLADFHAYGSWNNHSFKHHLARVESCPYALDCIFSEFGIDEGIVGNGGQGFKAHFNPEQYIGWLNAAQVGVRERLAKSKLRLKALNIFCYDSNTDWFSYDVREMRPQLEAAKWTIMAPPKNDGQPIPVPAPQPVPVLPPQPPSPPEGHNDLFDRSIAFVLKQEGGYSSDPNDPGNWKDGKFVGTKYGISGAVWGDQYNIAELSREQAVEIYRQHYWKASGADKLLWPLCLLHFDSAVQHGTGRASSFLAASGTNSWLYLATRIRFYTQIKTWHLYGKPWMNRLSDLMKEIGK